MPFYYFPTYLLGGLLIYLGPAAWLLYLAVWRRLTLSYPRCAKCKYDLRTCWDQSQCPECGSDIQQRGAVLFTEKDMFIRKRPLILAVIWLAAPVILSIFSYAHSQVSGIQALPRTYTATLINNLSDPDNMDSPWYWHEFERREAKGELSNEELEKIFAVLIEDLKAKPINKRGPLSWSGKFVTNIIDSGLLSYPTVVTFFETYYGYPSHCDGFMIDRDSQVTRIELDFGHPWELSNNQFEPQGFLNKVTLLDDKPTEIAIEPQQDAISDPEKQPEEALLLQRALDRGYELVAQDDAADVRGLVLLLHGHFVVGERQAVQDSFGLDLLVPLAVEDGL